MKCNRFYPIIIGLLFATWTVSCTQGRDGKSAEPRRVTAEVNFLLERAKADSLPKAQQLAFLNRAHVLAKKAAIDSLLLRTFNEKAEFYNLHLPDSALGVLKEFEKMAASKKDSLYIGYSFLNLGEHYLHLKRKDTALHYFHK